MPFIPPHPRLVDVVFERVADAILEGSLVEGSPINDKEIAAQLGVSRTPVREAILRLEQIGVIQIAPSRYTRVAPVSEKLARETHRYAKEFHASVVASLLDRPDHTMFQRVVDALAEIVEDVRRGDSVGRARYAFSRLILDSVDNSFVATINRDSDMAMARNTQHLDFIIDSPAQLAENYTALRDALLARDRERAVSLAYEQFALRSE